MSRAKAAAAERHDVYDIVTEKVIAALETGTVPWRKPWSTPAGALPLSLSTNKPYRGINVLLLALTQQVAGYASPWWGTYKKIAERGGQVRKGENGTLVTFWKRYPKTVTNEATGEAEKRNILVLKYYTVFNSEQADWAEGKAPVFDTAQPRTVERVDSAEKIVANYPQGPQVRPNGDAAYYTPATDTVTMPAIESFGVVDQYYSTLFHELTHSTGHESRLSREGVRNGSFGRFGDEVYSKEELVAEIGAALLCGVAGIDPESTLENTGAYLRSWLRVLKGDRKLIVQAAAQAQHAADLILGVIHPADEEA